MKLFFVLLGLLSLLGLSVANDDCDLCLGFVGVVPKLEGDYTDAQLLHFLHTACSAPMNPVKEQCESAVAEYAPTILKVFHNTTAEDICKQYQFCPTDAVMIKPRRGESTDCAICQETFALIHDVLVSKPKKEVKAFFNKACAFAEDKEAECQEVVKKYFDQIYQVFTILTAKGFCHMGKIC
eukprot:TRINITY_DN262_c0_g1_i1.p1 TRINITY_DN262_c0_g1~~TRINITY_DN262_c0_g1_i1.p1  ORF type:complete len:209 (+),score=46.72 TRINITY_DN262_c0_g1_i1:84-629(+)